MTTPANQPVFPITNGNYKMETEPIVGIGVVLAEDNKKSLSVALPEGTFRASVNGKGPEIAGPTRGDLTLRADNGAVALCGFDGSELARGAEIVLEPINLPREPRQGDGILVHGMVSGRGFHWNKEIDQTLTGALVVTNEGGNLVVVNRLSIEEYLVGVVTGEMSGDCPPEFIKAQCVAARAWLLAQPRSPHPGKSYVWCNDDCCQRYQGTGGWTEAARIAVAETRGEVLITASNQYCDARYSKNTGGISEDAHAVWHEEIEGLDAVVDAPEGSKVNDFFPVTDANVEEYIRGAWLADTDAWAGPKAVPEDSQSRYLGRVDESGTYFRWSVELSQDDLLGALRERAGVAEAAEVLRYEVVRRGKSGRLITLDVHYRDNTGGEKTHRLTSEYNIRAGLWRKFLYSSAFLIDEKRSASGALEGVTLHGAGWGHGAGLCQMGALGRALGGQDYRTILMAYYTNVRLEKIYP